MMHPLLAASVANAVMPTDRTAPPRPPSVHAAADVAPTTVRHAPPWPPATS